MSTPEDFRRWLQRALSELQAIAAHPERDLGDFDYARRIVRLAREHAIALRLPEAFQRCRVSRPSPDDAIAVVLGCLAALPRDDSADLTVAQAAERLNVAAKTVYDLCGSGKLAHHRIGAGRGTIRIKPGDLEEYRREASASRRSETGGLKYLERVASRSRPAPA